MQFVSAQEKLALEQKREELYKAQIDVQDSGLDRLNRELFADARDLEGSATRRGVAMRHMLIARSLERIGDNALGIARQAGFVVDGHRSSPASAPGP